MILAPAAMTAEKDPKVSAAKCFDSIGLDPDSYRIGHTKASLRVSPYRNYVEDFIPPPPPRSNRCIYWALS